jgi:hypothetical protein
MIAIGILILLGGGLLVAGAFFITASQLPPDEAAKVQQLEKQFPGLLRAAYLMMGGVAILAAIYHMAVGFLVRRGKRGAIYTAIATSFLALLFCAGYTLMGIVVAGSDAAGGVCFLVFVVALFIWLLFWLFDALRDGPSPAAIAQYQAQYWKMQQQHQAYVSQPRAGPPPPAGADAPPPPLSVFAPPAPPQPPSPEPTGWTYAAQTPPPPPPSGAQ